MEGVVIKPEEERENAPYLKVRNPEYLSIIYGYDYRFPHKYAKLLKQKHTQEAPHFDRRASAWKAPAWGKV